MEKIFIYISLIIISIAFSIKLNKRLGISIFVSIISISIMQYVLGIVGLLYFGQIATLWIVAFSVCYIIKSFIKNKDLKNFLKESWFDLLIFTFIYVLSFIVLKSKYVLAHNELSHWGLLLKDMIYHNNLPKADNNLLYVGYPPMARMWGYWFLTFFDTFSDSQMYIANAILQFSIVFATICSLNKNKLQTLLITIAFISVLFVINYLFFTTLFVDTILALLFVFLVTYIYKMDKMKRSDFFILVVTLTFFELIKEIAILFIIIILIYLTIMQRKYYKNEMKRLFHALLLIFLIICTFKNMWTLYLDKNNLNQPWDMTRI